MSTAVRDWDVMTGFRILLDATAAFDHVYLTSYEDRTPNPSDAYSAILQIDSWDEIDIFDDNGGITQQRAVSWILTLFGRGPDPEVRDRELDRIQGVVANALDGESLGSLVMPDLTKLRKGKWEKPVPPERRITIHGTFTYLIPDWDEHNTSA